MTPEGYDFRFQAQLRGVASRDIDFPCTPCIVHGSAQNAAYIRRLDKVSIDYGLMEKADNVLMVKADFAWDDVGTWGSLRRVMELDENGNYRSGRTICLDTKDSVICAQDVPIGVVGVANLIIVASPEGVLVCDGRRDQETRQIARMFDEEEE